MLESEHYVVRAAWQVCHDMGFTLDQADTFRNRLEAQLDSWHVDDQAQDEGIAA
jgi:hypothetical protein